MFINIASVTLYPIEESGNRLIGSGKGIEHLLKLFVNSSENAVLELSLQNDKKISLKKVRHEDRIYFQVLSD